MPVDCHEKNERSYCSSPIWPRTCAAPRMCFIASYSHVHVHEPPFLYMHSRPICLRNFKTKSAAP